MGVTATCRTAEWMSREPGETINEPTTAIPARTNNELRLEEEMASGADFEGIVGRSPALRQVLRLVQTAATSDSTVLLMGETGTGKELIARAIHDHSRRKQRALIKLNCPAIPSGLLESELFGHERGAFTGAIAQKTGRLELADQEIGRASCRERV